MLAQYCSHCFRHSSVFNVVSTNVADGVDHADSRFLWVTHLAMEVDLLELWGFDDGGGGVETVRGRQGLLATRMHQELVMHAAHDVATPARKREYITTYVNGKRHRSRTGTPLTKAHTLCLAREAKRKRTNKSATDAIVMKTQAALDEITALAKVQVNIKLVGSRAKRGNLLRSGSAVRAVRMASEAEPCMLSRGRSYNTTTKTVMRNMKATALLEIAARNALMDEKMKQLEEDPPAQTWVAAAEDETLQRVTVVVQGVRVRASWEICVMTRRAAWAWDDGRPVEHMYIIVPPVLVTGTAAANIWDASTSHPWTEPVFRFTNFLLHIPEKSTAELAMGCQFRCLDSAESNVKRRHWESVVIGPGPLLDSLPCLNHLNFIGEHAGTLAAHGEKPIVRQLSGARFLNASTHNLRCALGTREVIDRKLEVRVGTPEPEDVAYAGEVVSYLETWAHTKRRKAKPTNKNKKKKTTGPDGNTLMQKRAEAARRFLKRVQGGLYGRSDKIFVYAERPVSKEERAKVVDEVSQDAVAMLWEGSQPEPSLSKWTKAGPAGEADMVGSLGGLRRDIAKHALSKLNFTEKCSSKFGELDTQHTFSQVNGVRFKHFFAAIEDDDEHCLHRMDTVTHEAHRFLGSKYMEFSHASADLGGDLPTPLAMLGSDHYSPQYAALSYLSSLLAGISSRLQLILGFRNCKSTGEWRRKYPQDTMRFKGLTCMAIATIERRQRKKCMRAPLTLLAIRWLPRDSGVTVVGEFIQNPTCRQPHGFARDFHVRVLALPEATRVDAVLFRFNKIAPLSAVSKPGIADVEDLHAGNKRRAACTSSQVVSASNLVAQSALSQMGHERELMVEEKERSAGDRLAIHDAEDISHPDAEDNTPPQSGTIAYWPRLLLLSLGGQE